MLCEGVLCEGVLCEGVLGVSVSRDLKLERVLGGSEDVFSGGVSVYSDGRATKSASSTNTLGAAHRGRGHAG